MSLKSNFSKTLEGSSIIRNSFFIGCLLAFFSCSNFETTRPDFQEIRDALEINYDGDASIEVGSPYVGLEFHHSSPLAQRISFYYPVANSIDLSNDYWTRDQDFSMMLALKIGEGERELIGLEPFKYTLTPYDVQFNKEDDQKNVRIRYQFSKDTPVFVVTYELTNKTQKQQDFEFYSDMEASLKTSHTYAVKDKAWSEFREDGSSLFINFEDPETQNAQLFAVNAGLQPKSYSGVSSLDSLPAPKDWWKSINWELNDQAVTKNHPKTPAFRYTYKQQLEPGQSMKIVQIIGSAKQGEAYQIAKEIQANFRQEIQQYESQILATMQEKAFITGDSVLDHSVLWSHGILQANKHYIDGTIQPMPCPAEYNFYFTHDVLLTDLAAVNFDLPRVKQDLEFIVQHADSNKVIPHAYYWKDLDYTTEIAPPDNWNHFWFVITAGTYLRHSGDEDFARRIYPYVAQSVSQFLQNKKDHIIYSYRPDWWDIARNFGPRSYTTILATKALREFTFISAVLDKKASDIGHWVQTADELQQGLNQKLWSDKQNYLINYFEDGSLDKHYYIGSLLGSHYQLLNKDRKTKLVATAQQKIVDPKIGVYTVYPMDFQNLIDYLKLNGNEAGDPHYYINGGIWPHGNAWYALALMEAGKNKEALQFIRNIMTVKGVMNSPNGQPAMYEYRVSKKSDPQVYGKIDKPQFTWAAGWYLYSLYNVYGVKENEWNVRFEPFLPESQKSVNFVLTAGGYDIMVHYSGEGSQVQEILFDGKPQFATVLPYTISPDVEKIEIKKGILSTPLLTKLNAILEEATFDDSNKEMALQTRSFEGHKVSAVVKTPIPVKNVKLQNSDKKIEWRVNKESKNYELLIEFMQESNNDRLIISFGE